MPVHRSESCAKRHRIEQLNMQAQGRHLGPRRRSGQKELGAQVLFWGLVPDERAFSILWLFDLRT